MVNVSFSVAKLFKYFFHPSAVRQSKIHKSSRICPGCEIYDSIIDRYSYIGSRCFVVNTSIGKFCSIADRCSIGAAMHTIDYVSSSPVFNDGHNIMNKNFAFFSGKITPKTTIGNDVWIGMGCHIKAGVTIGDGAVIGMGSVLTKDVPPYEIWAGNPAKKIRNRFDEEDIKKLIKIKWWDWDDTTIERNAELFSDLGRFLSQHAKDDIK